MQNKAFELRYKGPTGGDETAPYFVDLNGTVTLEEFINTALSKKSEWGQICIHPKNSRPLNMDYDHGEAEIPDSIKEHYGDTVVSAAAHGG